jgi:hypothetical protein
MAFAPAIIFGDDMKDISASTCSLPPCELITSSTFSF